MSESLEEYLEKHSFIGKGGKKFYELEFKTEDLYQFTIEELNEILEINIDQENYEAASLITKVINAKKLLPKS